jgi:carbonic anhydrase/acetyltransferase-like protein (isoleucine patch superfamily)
MSARSFRIGPGLAKIPGSAFVARGAVVVGDVELGEEASVWFATVLRGDTERIRVGARSNVQDGTVIHADPGFPCLIGEAVTVGHRCVVHGAVVGDRCLIGMSSTLMNGAEIGEECIIGAGSLITEKKRIPPRSLVLGAPAKVVRPLSEAELLHLREAAEHYVEAGRLYLAAGYGGRGEPG